MKRNLLKMLKEELKKALEANNPEDIKAKTETLTEKFHAISTKLYEQAQAAGVDPSAAGFDPKMGCGRRRSRCRRCNNGPAGVT